MADLLSTGAEPVAPFRVARRRRHHGTQKLGAGKLRSSLRQLDRRSLERDGWRTTLELRENHVRLANGQLIDVETFWMAEAERDGVVICAAERSESRAWSRLRVLSRAGHREFTHVASA